MSSPHRVITVVAWAVVLGLAASCGPPAPPAPPAPPPTPFAPVVDVKRLMSGMVDPSADIVWASVSVVMDRDGEHIHRPTTDDEWKSVQDHAMIVSESANLLMIAPRARDDGEWMRLSKTLREAAAKAYEAALKKDSEALLLVGGEIYDACAACHKKYMPPTDEDPI